MSKAKEWVVKARVIRLKLPFLLRPQALVPGVKEDLEQTFTIPVREQVGLISMVLAPEDLGPKAVPEKNQGLVLVDVRH